MRLLHTSDWHLGRSLHRADLGAAQEQFLAHLIETVRQESVDAVLVAGDVYDRAVPPLAAVALCEDTLWQLRAAGASVVMISGNHDSGRRLGTHSKLLETADVHVRTRASACGVPVMLHDHHGEVPVYAVPYLEPAAVLTELPGLDDGGRGHAAVLGRALAAVRSDLEGRGRSIVLAHGWVTGAPASDSERDISVGGVGQVPASLFDGFSYAALGHLHGPHVLGEHLRYSGSPLPYSFSEAGHEKGSWLVELDANGLASVERIPTPVHRRLSSVRGRLDELLSSRAHAHLTDDYLAVVLTDTVRPAAAMDRLRARFPHVLTLAFEPAGVTVDGTSYRERVAGRSDLEVTESFVEHVRHAATTPGESSLLATALEAGRLAAAETTAAVVGEEAA